MSLHDQLTFEVPGPPVPKGRPRIIRRKDGSGGLYGFTPKRTVAYEKLVREAAMEALANWRFSYGTWPGHKRFAVSLFFFEGDKRGRDLDNMSKAILDSLNGMVFDDDRQIDELYAVRELDRENPRAVVVVRILP